MKIIFFRHGVKEYNNHTPCGEGKFQYDSPLKEGENQWKTNLMLKLLSEQCNTGNDNIGNDNRESCNENGCNSDRNNCFYPELVFCSPFVRTRETWEVLYKMFEYSEEFTSVFKDKKNFILDRDLREYFVPHNTANHRKKLDPTTLSHLDLAWDDIWMENYRSECQFCETNEKLEQRAKYFCDKLLMLKEYGYKCVWVISHGFTIKKCIEYLLSPAKSEHFYLKEGDMLTVNIEN